MQSQVPAVSLAIELSRLHTSLFTGRLDVESPSRCRWSFFVRLGRLVWQTGGHNPTERWRRLLKVHCPDVNPEDIDSIDLQRSKFGGYTVLIDWFRSLLVKREQMTNLVEAALVEVIFDILQERASCLLDSQQPCALKFYYDTSDALKTPLALLRGEWALTEATQRWESWQGAGLTIYSPNFVPVIYRPELHQTQSSDRGVKFLIQQIDGQSTLRGLATKLNRDVQKLTLILSRLMTEGAIRFIEVNEYLQEHPNQSLTSVSLPQISAVQTAQSSLQSFKPKLAPLVACIDDSSIICAQMEHIISDTGCQFLGIENSLTAIPTLLKNKPDLIFLDLVMPIANGYEVCTQIRRVSAFKDIPVIILTGNDGIVDRVRAKLAGASNFLAKPVNKLKVLPLLTKYLLI
jgi:two-component system, chemotaxis family, response regulator PixG